MSDEGEWQTQTSKKNQWHNQSNDDSSNNHKSNKAQKSKTEDETTAIPDQVKQYLTSFQKLLSSQSGSDEYRGDELLSYYDSQFNKISEKYFTTTTWPSEKAVAPLVDNDELFLTLYNQLATRHLVTKHTSKVTYKLRAQSYGTYESFFDSVSYGEVNFDLPSQWLWDIMDEFIYYFQSFSQYRQKRLSAQQQPSDAASLEELEQLKQDKVWSLRGVLDILENLINKSKIRSTLQNKEPLSTSGSKHVLQTLGYFSLIGLLRVNSLVGDYYGALQAVDCIEDMYKVEGSVHHRVLACHATLFYYVGYAYLVMRRYNDAVRCLASILNYLNRNKQIYNKSYQYDNMIRLSEQCYALLAIALTLYPQRVDPNVRNTLREMYGEKMRRMQRSLLSNNGTNDAFAIIEELLRFACPKFISPHLPSNGDFVKLQIKTFVHEAKQQKHCANMKSYLKLYSTISLDKLADQLETDSDTFRQNLTCLKHKSRQVVRAEDQSDHHGVVDSANAVGGPLSGDLANASDAEFYVEGDVVRVADFKPYKHYGEWFIYNIHKFENIIENLEK
ncbi:translation initiation factor 3 subunit L [Acrasis kona]|uniref:Eukaryotic translation initiation factor 3 subunit L n=1 Tax=Acrasis kona TaxID=1008807 RepID=A0AAW2YXS7_9EUKA